MDQIQMDSKMHPLYHEIGHWMVANSLGVEGKITGNLEENRGFSFIQTSKLEENIENLEKSLLIGFGGLASEEIMKIPPNAGCIGDLLISCENLKKLFYLKNKKFEYKSYLDFPVELYESYLSQGKNIIKSIGGKEKILELGNYIYSELNKKN